MSALRNEKRLLADRRAVEEQKEREADENPDAHGSGRRLSEHLMKLHGGAFHKEFMRGMAAYGNPDVSAKPVGFDSLVPQKAKATPKMLKKGGGPLKVEIEHESSEEEECKGGALTGRYEGEGRVGAGRMGAGHVGAGKVDGRKARAEIVKKVMAEKGMKLVEASKYVKEHGLY